MAVDDPRGNRTQELVVRDRIEILRQVGVHHVGEPLAQQSVHRLDRIDAAAARSVTIGTRFEVRLEDRLRLRLEIELPLKRPDVIRCCQAHRQSPILGSYESAPEVRVLPSTGVTQPQQYYDPVRRPRGPSSRRCRRRDLRPTWASPNY